MAGSINRVCLLGYLGKDVEVRQFPSGEMASFSMATSEQWRDKATGDRRERTEWHNIVIYNENLVKLAQDYLRKGSRVYLEGQMQTRKWQDRDGRDRWTTEVVLRPFNSMLVLLDRKEDRGDGGARDGGYDREAGERTTTPAQVQPATQVARPRDELDDEEIPFAWALWFVGGGLVIMMLSHGMVA